MMKSCLSGNDKERDNDNKRQIEKARQAALRKLSARERTEKEILDFLKEAGCTHEEAAEITAEFREWGYIDDEKYCRRYFEYGRSKGKAAPRIVSELTQKGISSEKARRVLAAMKEEAGGDGWTEDRQAALSVGMKMTAAQRELGKAIDDKFLAKVGRRLTGLGYDSGTCHYVIGKIRDYGREREREREDE